MTESRISHWIELLCGQPVAPTNYANELIIDFPKPGLGRSQLNEILLAYQLDRIDEGLFEFIFKNEPILNFETFKTHINEFRVLGAIRFGNFKFAYKHLRDKRIDEIRQTFGLSDGNPEGAFRKRHPPVVSLEKIDPKETYTNRIDKGLVEGLMLKRAKCTIYLAGETETLGKDSELAATLAQGKTVIAYVPSLDDFEKFKTEFVQKVFTEVYPDEKPVEVALRFLQHVWPDGAWKSEKVRKWLQSRNHELVDEVVEEVYDRAKALYDRRAQMLKEIHPLGLQVHLETGVANGVLVARTVPECAKLLKRVVLRNLEFRLEERDGVYAVIETSTSSIYRVVTGDSHLTNSYWNFYKY
jgi:hypothetical protein